MKKIALALLCASLTGCAAVAKKLPFLGKKEALVGGVYSQNLDEERLVDLVIVKKLSGAKKFWLMEAYTPYLEGYLRGVVVDYDDVPIEGVVVRVTDGAQDSPGFDPGISDVNGIYRIRFSVPIVKEKVDLSASIAYNPPWEQQLGMLGAAIEAQTKLTKFRLYYDRKNAIIGIGEDAPKTIVRKVTGTLAEIERKKGAAKPAPGKKAPPPPAEAKPAPQPKKESQENQDFFGGFGEFGQ